MALAPAVLLGRHALCEPCEGESACKRYQTKQQRQNCTCTARGPHALDSGTIFHTRLITQDDKPLDGESKWARRTTAKSPSLDKAR